MHIITYDLILRVSTLLRHLQGVLRAKHEGLPEDEVLTSKHVGSNHM
jgi:hypothetical protein